MHRHTPGSRRAAAVLIPLRSPDWKPTESRWNRCACHSAHRASGSRRGAALRGVVQIVSQQSRDGTGAPVTQACRPRPVSTAPWRLSCRGVSRPETSRATKEATPITQCAPLRVLLPPDGGGFHSGSWSAPPRNLGADRAGRVARCPDGDASARWLLIRGRSPGWKPATSPPAPGPRPCAARSRPPVPWIRGRPRNTGSADG